MKREPKKLDEGGCPLWVVTFGDAMSLLVTFFVMLVSFADFEEHSLQNMMGALKGGLRAVPLPMATTSARVEADVDGITDPKTTSTEISGQADGTQTLKNQPAKNIVRPNSPDYYLHLLKNGVSLVINREAVFDVGTTDLANPDHEVWQMAAELMNSVNNEIRVAITLPENVVVRLPGYTTSWGLGIEQAMTVQEYISRRSGGDIGQISTSVRVVRSMPQGEDLDGIVEIRFIGASITKMKGMPRKILRGMWRETDSAEKEAGHGQGS